MSLPRSIKAVLVCLFIISATACENIPALGVCKTNEVGGNGVFLYVMKNSETTPKCFSRNYIDNGETATISWKVKTEGLVSLTVDGVAQSLSGDEFQEGSFEVSPPETRSYSLTAEYINNNTRTLNHTLYVDELKITTQIPDQHLAKCIIAKWDREYVNQYILHTTPPGALVCHPTIEEGVKTSQVLDLEGIEIFTSFVALDFSGNDIADLSELSLLPILSTLDISENSAVTTLSGLSGATNLESLTISNASSLTDASVLTSLVPTASGNLQFVNASGITDASACSTFVAMDLLPSVGVISPECPAP